MEFKSIKIAGFLSYYKEVELKFSDGTTVIIGLNNSGKSKLFDAFHWVLFERIYDAQNEKWLEGADVISKMVLNNRLRKEASENKGDASTYVELELTSE